MPHNPHFIWHAIDELSQLPERVERGGHNLSTVFPEQQFVIKGQQGAFNHLVSLDLPLKPGFIKLLGQIVSSIKHSGHLRWELIKHNCSRLAGAQWHSATDADFHFLLHLNAANHTLQNCGELLHLRHVHHCEGIHHHKKNKQQRHEVRKAH